MERHNDVLEILIDRNRLAKRIKEMGEQISKDKTGKSLVVISILKGSWIFLADLVREIELDVDVEFMSISSYGSGTTSSGKITINMDLNTSVEGKDVMIVEDIVDSGYTIEYMLQLLKERGAKSVSIATLLSKPSRRKVQIPIDYVGF